MERTTDRDRITYDVVEVAGFLGIGKTLAYELIKRGELPAVRLGRRLVVPRAALEQWLQVQGSATCA